MCGIFGIIKINPEEDVIPKLKKDLQLLFKLSSIRGVDASGLVTKSGSEINILRQSIKPQELVKTSLFSKSLKPLEDGAKKSNPLFTMGHCRLVTNGAASLDENNQPICNETTIGLHNGIVTNFDQPSTSFTKEGLGVESDSKYLFQNIENKIKTTGDFKRSIVDVFSELEGVCNISLLNKSTEKLILSTNTGSIYFASENGLFVFTSEEKILREFVSKSCLVNNKSISINQLKANHILEVDINTALFTTASFMEVLQQKENVEIIKPSSSRVRFIKYHRENLKRCTKCILPETYPFISFDNNGVCNFCNRYVKQVPHGEEKLLRILDKYRSKDGSNDCLVGLSGGRDSCYGVHLLKTKYGMNPICYTYDWGLTTDTARINQSKIAGKLGIEHIIRAADVSQKRAFLRSNVMAWLKRPRLGMVPLFMAGDKDFFYYGKQLLKETNVKLSIFCSGYQLEQREFFIGFTGVNQNLQNNLKMQNYKYITKFRLAMYYIMEYLKNPAYINHSFFDSIRAFFSSFLQKDNILYLFEYLPWDEKEIESVLKKEYNWATDAGYGKNQWRAGDGQTSFTNYIFYKMAGFSEFDDFRSNQVREGLLTRAEALELAMEDNIPKYESLKYFGEVVGLNMDDTLKRINNIPPIYN